MLIKHPGQYISEVYLQPYNISQAALADRIEVDRSTISRVLSGRADMTPHLAVRLSKVFEDSAAFWMGMQASWDLQKAEKALEGFRPALF